MKFSALFCAVVLLQMANDAHARVAGQADEFRQLTKVEALPMALDRDFQFRKTKLFALGMPGPKGLGFLPNGPSRNPAITNENSYRLFGAVTNLDKRARYGNYLDFFWRSKQPVPVVVRLEYRQEKLRSLTEAREVSYPNAKGSHKTAFAVIGDDYFSDGRITAWRCVLIVNGRIVAEDRSYLW